MVSASHSASGYIWFVNLELEIFGLEIYDLYSLIISAFIE